MSNQPHGTSTARQGRSIFGSLRRGPALAVGVVSAVGILGAAMIGAPADAAVTTGVELQWHVDNDWGSGFQATATITNRTTSTLNPWTIDLFTTNKVTDLWNGTKSAIPNNPAGFRTTAVTS